MIAANAFISLGAVLTGTAYAALATPPMVPRTAAVRAESPSPSVTSTEFVSPFVTPDPVACYLGNITQSFDVTTAGGALSTAMASYGDVLLEPCVSTATGIDRLDCSVAPSQWCGLSTAIPPAIL